MNLQEIFNKIYLHAQKKQPSFINGQYGRCAYRGPNGAMCFIGCCIPDERYDPKFDSNFIGLHEVLHELPDVLATNNVRYDQIRALQLIHDQHPPCDWNTLLKEFANTYELTIPV